MPASPGWTLHGDNLVTILVEALVSRDTCLAVPWQGAWLDPKALTTKHTINSA
jgi:hypothetical protein